jgi:hypothetical protein
MVRDLGLLERRPRTLGVICIRSCRLAGRLLLHVAALNWSREVSWLLLWGLLISRVRLGIWVLLHLLRLLLLVAWLLRLLLLSLLTLLLLNPLLLICQLLATLLDLRLEHLSEVHEFLSGIEVLGRARRLGVVERPQLVEAPLVLDFLVFCQQSNATHLLWFVHWDLLGCAGSSQLRRLGLWSALRLLALAALIHCPWLPQVSSMCLGLRAAVI